MLEKLFGSKTKVRILKALAFNPEKKFHLRELSREIKITPIYVSKEIDILKMLNLVLESKVGNMRIFQINKNAAIYTEIKSIIFKTEFFIDTLKESMKDGKVDFAFIFGSFAKSTESEDSDIDIFIIGDIKNSEIIKLIKPVEKAINREINSVVWSFDELKAKKGRPLIKDIAKDKIIMLKGDENELRKIIGR